MSNHIAAGTPSEMVPHMEAVATFVKQLGGLQYLGIDGIVTDNIVYGDHTRAILYNSRPSFPLVMPSLEVQERRVAFSRYLGTAFHTLFITGNISEHLYDAARDISLLTDIYNRAAHKRIHEQETTYFDYLNTAVEYQLAELNFIHHNASNLEDMLTLAFLLIDLTIFRNYGNISPLVPIVEERFWRCFTNLRGEGLPGIENSAQLFTWLAFTGAITQTRRKCPYVKTAVLALLGIRKETGKQSISSFDQISRNVLDLYLWCLPVQKHVCEAIWEEVLESESISRRAAAWEKTPPVLRDDTEASLCEAS